MFVYRQIPCRRKRNYLLTHFCIQHDMPSPVSQTINHLSTYITYSVQIKKLTKIWWRILKINKNIGYKTVSYEDDAFFVPWMLLFLVWEPVCIVFLFSCRLRICFLRNFCISLNEYKVDFGKFRDAINCVWLIHLAGLANVSRHSSSREFESGHKRNCSLPNASSNK